MNGIHVCIISISNYNIIISFSTCCRGTLTLEKKCTSVISTRTVIKTKLQMICMIKIHLSYLKNAEKLRLFIAAKLFYYAKDPACEKEEISIINRNMGRLKNKWSVLSWSQQPDHLTICVDVSLSKVYFVCKKREK